MMGWLPEAREHTFKSGRTAQITDAPNVYALFTNEEILPYLSEFQAGELSDPTVGMKIAEEVARAMMVRPRILGRDEPMPPGQDPDDPEVIPYMALLSSEVDELLDLWTASIESAARFRGESGGDGDGAGGEDVGGDAKPRARSKGGKRAGVAG